MILILLSNFEYILLRLVRRFLFTEAFLLRFGRYIPYYKANQGQISPVPIVDSYFKYSRKMDISLLNQAMLEIGTGATNATGYEIMARLGGGHYWGYEPIVALDDNLDRKILMEVAKRFYKSEMSLNNKVYRLRNIKKIKTKSINMVFSNSVLEHVTDLSSLLFELHRVLRDDGCMIHLVDYRDHFFKYPYHFLQFSEKVWNSFLNPGDLPRYQLCDHLEAFNQNGFSVTTIEKKCDDEAYSKIKDKIHPKFQHGDKDVAEITFAVLAVKKMK